MQFFLRFIGIAVLTLSVMTISAQSYNIGIRAGLSQNTFSGPTEEGERYGLAGGFHFGFNFQWNFNEFVGLRSEILYNQMGSSYDVDTNNGYYVFTPNDGLGNVIIRDSSLITLDHSNAYLQLPQTFHFRLHEKVELFAGGYVGLMLSPVATGNIQFGGGIATKDHSFRQGLNLQYNSDDERTKFGDGFRTPAAGTITIRAEGREVDLRRVENSYDLMTFNTEDSKFLNVDLGLTFGASYYLNKGLYIMGRVDYGMRDITRNVADFSLVDVDTDGNPIYNNDKDRNIGYYLSIGFKF